MGRVRACVESDVPHIAELYRRVWTSDTDRPLAYSEAYYAEMLFRNVGHDDDMPSLVYEDAKGEVIGCLGVMPRRMSLRGRPVRMAISHNFMVAPGRRSSLAGAHLLRAFFAGSQDLSIAESNEVAGRVWQGLGGSTAPIYEMVWTRPLRPGGYLATFIRSRQNGRREPFWLRPVARIIDAVATAMPSTTFRPATPLGTSEALTIETFLKFFDELMEDRSLRPEYDEHSLRWLFNVLQRKTRYGTLRARAVRDGENRLLGWFLYYAKPGGDGEVVQIATRPASAGEVLDHCFYDAWRLGLSALSGQIDPRLKRQLSAKHCLFRDSRTWMLVNTRDPEIMQALCRGDAFLTRLEGEWWIIP